MSRSTACGARRKCITVGDGMHIFGVTEVWSRTNAKWRSIGWSAGKRTRSRISTASGAGAAPWNAMPLCPSTTSTPSSRSKKSKCHQPRRNSPSVTACRPTSSCLRMTSRIASSSICVSPAASSRPSARAVRASCTACGRRKLPTMSARNGGGGVAMRPVYRVREHFA